jgi:hypothetical protein
MILGMSTEAFTWFHVVLSLTGIFSGAAVLFGMLRATRFDRWTALFLAATALTSATGFFFHSVEFGAPHALGVLSLVAVTVAIVAIYTFHLDGPWRWIYVAGAMAALYLNVFVGVVQAFSKLPFLSPLAPTQTEPPFLIAQLLVLAIFIALGVFAIKRFHPAAKSPALSST